MVPLQLLMNGGGVDEDWVTDRLTSQYCILKLDVLNSLKILLLPPKGICSLFPTRRCAYQQQRGEGSYGTASRRLTTSSRGPQSNAMRDLPRTLLFLQLRNHVKATQPAEQSCLVAINNVDLMSTAEIPRSANLASSNFRVSSCPSTTYYTSALLSPTPVLRSSV